MKQQKIRFNGLKSIGWIALVVIVVLYELLSTSIATLLYAAFDYFFGLPISINIIGSIMSIFCSALIAGIFYAWYYIVVPRPQVKGISLQPSRKWLFVVILIGLGKVMFVLSRAILWNGFETSQSENINVLSILRAIVFAPIGEEFACRGVLLHYAKRMTSKFKCRRFAFYLANLTQAFIFAWIHFDDDVNLMLWKMVGALFAGYLVSRYHSLIPAIIAHAIHNLMCYVAIWCTPLISGFSDMVFEITSVIAVLMMLTGFVLSKPEKTRKTV